MNIARIIRLFACLFAFSLCLYAYMDKQNELTEMRIALPVLNKKVKALQEENIRLQYEVDRFKSPAHLMELARHPEFGYLKYPLLKDVVMLPEGIALEMPLSEEQLVAAQERPKGPSREKAIARGKRDK